MRNAVTASLLARKAKQRLKDADALGRILKRIYRIPCRFIAARSTIKIVRKLLDDVNATAGGALSVLERVVKCEPQSLAQ